MPRLRAARPISLGGNAGFVWPARRAACTGAGVGRVLRRMDRRKEVGRILYVSEEERW